MKKLLWVVLASLFVSVASAADLSGPNNLIYPPEYQPPACTGAFSDVPCPSMYADWVERLYAEGITAGCGVGIFCPDTTMPRSQIAVWTIKAEHSILERFATGTVACENQYDVTTIKCYATKYDERVSHDSVVMLTYLDDGTKYPARIVGVYNGGFTYEIQIGQRAAYLAFNPDGSGR